MKTKKKTLLFILAGLFKRTYASVTSPTHTNAVITFFMLCVSVTFLLLYGVFFTLVVVAMKWNGHWFGCEDFFSAFLPLNDFFMRPNKRFTFMYVCYSFSCLTGEHSVVKKHQKYKLYRTELHIGFMLCKAISVIFEYFCKKNANNTKNVCLNNI